MWETSGPRQYPSRRVAALLFLVFLAAGGSGLLLSGITGRSSPRPPQPAPAAAPAELAGGNGGGAGEQTGQALARSVPVRVAIPAIEVDADLMGLGVDEAGEVEVPPLARADEAGWYEHGAAPGEPGNAVIIGHVDSRRRGPAVFFNLGRLQPGDRVEVERADGSIAEFAVDGVVSYPKSQFPADLVYGPTDRPSLRLVTCGGDFDRAQRDYQDNVVVFATLASDPPRSGGTDDQ